MYAPDGTLGDIPWDRMSEALRAGAKMGVHMKAPDGTDGIIPAERLQEAVKQGGQVIPYDLSKAPANKKGIWDTFADDVKSIFSGSGTPQTTGKSTSRVGAHVEEVKEDEALAASRKAAGYGLPYRTAAPVGDVFANIQGMEEAAKQGNSDAVIGHMLAGQALAAAPLAAEPLGAVAKSIPKVGPAIGTALRTETGALKPGVKAVAAVGKLAGGPEIAEALIPGRPDAATMMERRAVPITKSPNYNPEAYKAGVALRTKGTLSEMAEAPQIATPEDGPPKPTGSEGRPATWTNERVIQLATQGNRDAISQAVRRGFMLPENVRYVMGDMDYPSAVHNPRSVTKFTPTGEPITQGESDFAYRSRDVGEKGVPADQRSHAHATTDLGDLQQLAPGRESITGKRQEFVKVDLSKLDEGKDFARMHRADQPDWIRFLRPLEENELEKLPSTTSGPSELAEHLGAKVVGSASQKVMPGHDWDLRIEGNYDTNGTISKMKSIGFDDRGSSLVSPQEAKTSGKNFGSSGWKRVEHFENATGQKVDIWHDEAEAQSKPHRFSNSSKTRQQILDLAKENPPSEQK